MSKVKNNYVKSKYPKRDIITAIISVCALAGLIFFLKYALYKQGNAQQESIKEGYINQDQETKERNSQIAKMDICINEICRDKVENINDEEICIVEICNPSDVQVDISDYVLYINNKKNSYIFPKDTIMKAQELKTINISPKETNTSGICYQLLYNGDECIRMYSSTEELIDQMIIPEIDENESYGRVENGNICYEYIKSSIGIQNKEEDIIKKDYPVFSVPSGFYDSSFQLEISANDEFRIYYSTDGSNPTVNSIEYTKPIQIVDVSLNENAYCNRTDLSMNRYTIPSSKVDKATIIKAVAINESGKCSDVITATYFINFSQKLNNYGMDIISIVTEPKNLFDYWDGIYVNGVTYDNAVITESVAGTTANYWENWTKDGHVYYFSKNGYLSYENTCKLATYNDAYLNKAQKSLELSGLIKKGWDSGFEDFIDFSKKEGAIILSSGRNDSTTLVRNRLIQDSMKQSKVGTQQIKECIVFLDGEFWGVYNIVQNYTEDTISEQYGVESNDVVLLDTQRVLHGKRNDLEDYNNMIEQISTMDMSQSDNYNLFCSMVDIESVIDYYSCQIYVGTSDWIPAQTYIWRTNKSSNQPYYDEKWRWMLYETDSSAGIDSKSGVSIDSFLSIGLQKDPLYNALINNQSFCNLLVEKIIDIGNVTFSSEQVLSRLNEYSIMYKNGIIKSYDRYGIIGGENAYQSNMKKLNQFYSDRMFYMIRYIKEHLVKDNIVTTFTVTISDPMMGTVLLKDKDLLLGNKSWSGYFLLNSNLELEAVPVEGYKFVGWNAEKGIGCNNTLDKKLKFKLIDDVCSLTAVFKKEE